MSGIIVVCMCMCIYVIRYTYNTNSTTTTTTTSLLYKSNTTSTILPTNTGRVIAIDSKNKLSKTHQATGFYGSTHVSMCNCEYIYSVWSRWLSGTTKS